MAALPIREIRAHFDGTVIVPDETVDLPEGTRLVVRLAWETEASPPSEVVQKRLEGLRDMFTSLPRANVSPDFDPARLTRDDYYL